MAKGIRSLAGGVCNGKTASCCGMKCVGVCFFGEGGNVFVAPKELPGDQPIWHQLEAELAPIWSKLVQVGSKVACCWDQVGFKSMSMLAHKISIPPC